MRENETVLFKPLLVWFSSFTSESHPIIITFHISPPMLIQLYSDLFTTRTQVLYRFLPLTLEKEKILYHLIFLSQYHLVKLFHLFVCFGLVLLFLGPHPRHMEVPRLGVKLEL